MGKGCWRVKVLLASLLCAALVACGGDDTTGKEAAVPTSAASLYGEWKAVDSGGTPITLTLRDGAYTILRGSNSGSGRLKATSSEAEFSGSDLCNGVGRYRWSIAGGALTFVALEKEACPGRSAVLDATTYRK
jgi:hypothetical protein